MNGPHDLGGQMGFEPVAPESDEPVFHSEWERRAFAVTLAMGATRQSNAGWELERPNIRIARVNEH